MIAIAAVLLGLAGPATAQTDPAAKAEAGNLQPVPFTAVTFNDNFWSPRIRIIAERTLPHVFKMCEETGRIRNWEKAAQALKQRNADGVGEIGGAQPAAAPNAANASLDYEGYFFNDSDVYKAMEGAAYVLQLYPDAKYNGRPLGEYLDELIAKIAAMQWPDGYVNSYFTLKRATEPRWTDIENKHELYCAGHLIEAAVAHRRATGKDNFYNIALELAEHLCDTFGPKKNPNPCGHPEIELALMKLADLVVELAGDYGPYVEEPKRYRGLAKFFIDQHGRKDGREKLWGDYALDDVPLAERREVAGHAVRAMYLFCGATDLARRGAGDAYVPALDSIWRDLTERRMYITGGIGPSAHNEGFTTPYDLPNDSAYAETCAAIGLCLWAQRMNLLHADGSYFDVLERALYNGVLSGISADGESFFYTNPLASRGQHERKPWYACACCPPNLLRFIPGVGGLMYATSPDGKHLYVNLFADSQATVKLSDDLTVKISQTTGYPWGGNVTLTIEPSGPAEFTLHVRKPAWALDYAMQVADEKIAEPTIERGYCVILRRWDGRASVQCQLGGMPQLVRADSRVKADVGRVAVQCGPIVYCLEAADHDGRARNLAFTQLEQMKYTYDHRRSFPKAEPVLNEPPDAPPRLPYGVVEGWIEIVVPPGDSTALYRGSLHRTQRRFRAIPYHLWANRGPGEMVVWIPESPALVEPPPVAWLKPTASHCWRSDTLTALHDRIEPANSADQSIPRFTWWPKRGGEQWVQYDFSEPRSVSAVEVYWFDDGASGACRPPASWKLLYRAASEAGDSWHEVQPTAAGYGAAADQFNRLEFAVVKTDALRIVVQLAPEKSAGLLEWRVQSAEP